ncbi:hypothetical protein NLG97_g4265 [Lecanicillium saksenae]|uniref:Uncharacterized protein n=1 Tax=Lecanicillium saksenae TaxID=468837 RepID=A0ACC1QWC4_9HYPO|nr:hypothetical protein NLG97_g4265 [Lecanicillium saksenae]
MAFGLNTAQLILSKIPLLIKTIVFHVLSLSPTARKWDFRTEVVVTMLRDLLINSPASSISEQQALFMHDVPIRGKMWVSKATLPAPPPEDGDVCEHLFHAIAALGSGREQYTKPPLQEVSGEWVGVRHGVSDKEPEPVSMSEREKFDSLTKAAETDVTVLYIHGGANYLMDPVSTRPVALAYATYAKCRVFSVRYRLAPQGPFPASLLDAFVAYLSLLRPPPGSWHEAVPASSLFLSGDSAGGNISMALVQLLLQLHRAAAGKTPMVRFHGEDVAVPLPAGVGLNSPSLDLTRSMQWSEEFACMTTCHRRKCPPSPRRRAQSGRPSRRACTYTARVALFCKADTIIMAVVLNRISLSTANSAQLHHQAGRCVVGDIKAVDCHHRPRLGEARRLPMGAGGFGEVLCLRLCCHYDWQ